MGAVVAGKMQSNSVGVRKIPVSRETVERKRTGTGGIYDWLEVYARGVHLKILISWQARVSEMKCRFVAQGGWGGSAPPKQHIRSKG